jgi:CubicO group peptidase (beta-lactamase class C family)
VTDDTVYLRSQDNFHAPSAEDGTEQWRFRTNSYSSPAVADGTVYVDVYLRDIGLDDKYEITSWGEMYLGGDVEAELRRPLPAMRLPDTVRPGWWAGFGWPSGSEDDVDVGDLAQGRFVEVVLVVGDERAAGLVCRGQVQEVDGIEIHALGLKFFVEIGGFGRGVGGERQYPVET